MIQEEYCTLETAKLLKEAGFPQEDDYKYYDGVDGFLCAHPDECVSEAKYAVPTQAQAMRWLREEHGISVEPGVSLSDKWLCDVLEFKSILNLFDKEFIFPTYEAAVEAGIQAACKYLIEEN